MMRVYMRNTLWAPDLEEIKQSVREENARRERARVEVAERRARVEGARCSPL